MPCIFINILSVPNQLKLLFNQKKLSLKMAFKEAYVAPPPSKHLAHLGSPASFHQFLKII